MEAMLFPVSIQRTVMHLDSKPGKTLLSVAYIATFKDGKTKVRCVQSWCKNDLLHCANAHGFEEILSMDTCRLYYSDWSHINHAVLTKANKRSKEVHI